MVRNCFCARPPPPFSRFRGSHLFFLHPFFLDQVWVHHVVCHMYFCRIFPSTDTR